MRPGKFALVCVSKPAGPRNPVTGLKMMLSVRFNETPAMPRSSALTTTSHVPPELRLPGVLNVRFKLKEMLAAVATAANCSAAAPAASPRSNRARFISAPPSKLNKLTSPLAWRPTASWLSTPALG
jgi:hypothetical protein